MAGAGIVQLVYARLGAARLLLESTADAPRKHLVASKVQRAALEELANSVAYKSLDTAGVAGLVEQASKLKWAEGDGEAVLLVLSQHLSSSGHAIRRRAQMYMSFPRYIHLETWQQLRDSEIDMQMKKAMILEVLQRLHLSCPCERTYKFIVSFWCYVSSASVDDCYKIPLAMRKSLLGDIKIAFEKIQRKQRRLHHPLELPEDPTKFQRSYPDVWAEVFPIGQGPAFVEPKLWMEVTTFDDSWRCRGGGISLCKQRSREEGAMLDSPDMNNAGQMMLMMNMMQSMQQNLQQQNLQQLQQQPAHPVLGQARQRKPKCLPAATPGIVQDSSMLLALQEVGRTQRLPPLGGGPLIEEVDSQEPVGRVGVDEPLPMTAPARELADVDEEQVDKPTTAPASTTTLAAQTAVTSSDFSSKAAEDLAMMVGYLNQRAEAKGAEATPRRKASTEADAPASSTCKAVAKAKSVQPKGPPV